MSFELSPEPAYTPKPAIEPKYIRPPKEKKATRDHIDMERRANDLPPLDPVCIHPDEEWFRHHYWKAKRAQVITALASAGISARTLFNVQNCGAGCSVEYSKEEGKYRLRGSYCHCRHCEPCMRAKGNLMLNNLRERLKLEADGRYRFITLTLRHASDEPLKPQLDRLNACYKKLRNHPIWKSSQRGGAATLEVKYSVKGGWHPHLHIVAEGDFIRQADLAAVWYEITGDSFKADIRKIDSSKDAAYYVSKYISKGCNAEVWQDEAVAVEWITAMKGVRTAATFGTWRGYKLLQKPPQTAGWTTIASLQEIAAKARLGEMWAIQICMHLEDVMQYNPSRKRQPKDEPS